MFANFGLIYNILQAMKYFNYKPYCVSMCNICWQFPNIFWVNFSYCARFQFSLLISIKIIEFWL